MKYTNTWLRGLVPALAVVGCLLCAGPANAGAPAASARIKSERFPVLLSRPGRPAHINLQTSCNTAPCTAYLQAFIVARSEGGNHYDSPVESASLSLPEGDSSSLGFPLPDATSDALSSVMGCGALACYDDTDVTVVLGGVIHTAKGDVRVYDAGHYAHIGD